MRYTQNQHHTSCAKMYQPDFLITSTYAIGLSVSVVFNQSAIKLTWITGGYSYWQKEPWPPYSIPIYPTLEYNCIQWLYNLLGPVFDWQWTLTRVSCTCMALNNKHVTWCKFALILSGFHSVYYMCNYLWLQGSRGGAGQGGAG